MSRLPGWRRRIGGEYYIGEWGYVLSRACQKRIRKDTRERDSALIRQIEDVAKLVGLAVLAVTLEQADRGTQVSTFEP